MRLKESRIRILLILLVLVVFVPSNSSDAGINFPNKAFAYVYYEDSGALDIFSSGASEFLLETPRNISGAIRIQTWGKDEVVVKFEKKSKADTEKEAREFVQSIEFLLDKTGDAVILEVSSPRHAPWQGTDKSVTLHLDIFIPENLNLKSETIYFDLHVSGPHKSVEIANAYGKIYVRDVRGKTDIQTSYGGVEAEDLLGGVNIETSYGAIYISDVDTQDKTAFLKTAYDKIEMRKVRGNIKARTNYNFIKGTDLELLEGISSFETVYNKIDLKIKELNDCDLFIENTYGNVNLGLTPGVSTELLFSIDPGGKIETLGLPILIQSIDQTNLQGTLGEGESKIEVEISGIGKILLESY